MTRSHSSNRPKSAALSNPAQEVLPGGVARHRAYTAPQPLFLARGEAANVFDVDGRKYRDLQNNLAASIQGHCLAAVERQLAQGACFSNPTESGIHLMALRRRRLDMSA